VTGSAVAAERPWPLRRRRRSARARRRLLRPSRRQDGSARSIRRVPPRADTVRGGCPGNAVFDLHDLQRARSGLWPTAVVLLGYELVTAGTSPSAGSVASKPSSASSRCSRSSRCGDSGAPGRPDRTSTARWRDLVGRADGLRLATGSDASARPQREGAVPRSPTPQGSSAKGTRGGRKDPLRIRAGRRLAPKATGRPRRSEHRGPEGGGAILPRSTEG
jgi:hypothetical protein